MNWGVALGGPRPLFRHKGPAEKARSNLIVRAELFVAAHCVDTQTEASRPHLPS
jgi:hypothetical protein